MVYLLQIEQHKIIRDSKYSTMTEVDPATPVGLGIAMPIPDDITSEQVWKALLIKIKQPDLFLPVSEVVTRPSDDGVGTYREMSMGNTRIIENIYTNESIFEVNFSVISDPTDHVNVILTDPAGRRTLEFYKRNTESKERVHWTVPATVAMGGINKVLEMARTL